MKIGQRTRSRSKKAMCSVLAASMFAATAVSAVPLGAFAENNGGTFTAASASTVAAMDGLQMWFDANDLSLSDGAKVSKLTNKAEPTLAGAGDATQNTASRQPVYISDSNVNGKAAVRMDAQSYMRVGGTNGFYLNDMTIIVVGNMHYDGTGTREIFSRLAGEPYNHNWYFNLENGFNYGWGSLNGTNVSQNQARVAFTPDAPAVFVGRKSGASGMSMINGAVMSEFSGRGPQNVNTPVYLGSAGGNSAECDIGEILVFDRGLSDEELRSVNSYLFDKWAFESSDGCALDGIYVDGRQVSGFSPYKYNYEILAEDVDMSKITATVRYNGAAAEKSVKGNKVTFKVTNPLCSESKTYTVSFKVLPEAADRLTRVDISDVKLNDGYWKDTVTQYMTYSLDYIFDMFDYSYSFDNFDRIARGERKVLGNTSVHAGQILIPSYENRLIGDKDGRWDWGNEPWREGLIYEEIRAVSDFIAMYGDDAVLGEKARALKTRTEGYIDRIVAAGLTTTGSDRNGKRIDGYFDTFVMLTQTGVIDEAESGHVWNHDMYNLGCMIEAGMSWYRATGDTRLLFIATRFAEFTVDYMYGENGYDVVPSHQLGEETLLALYRLYKDNPALVEEMKVTYDEYDGIDPTDKYYKFDIRWEKYIDIVKDWVEKRGVQSGRYNSVGYGDYAQDHATYDKQTTAAGHSVRANLWYSGIAAAGNYLDDKSYLVAANTIWNDIVDHQMYINGGTGSVHDGERYGGDDHLPHDGYCETCAAVGMGFFALNMSDIFGDSQYADVLELELYNGILGCLGTDGQSFYYQNPLTSDLYQRPLWSGATPCCPPMYMKFFSMLPTYVYSYNAEKLAVNQYISTSADIKVGDVAVEIDQYTDLPDGDVAVFDVKANGAFKLALRNPDWAHSATVKVNGSKIDAVVGDDGYIVIDRTWSGTTRVEISFGKEPERIYQNNATANLGQVAFRYGPFLYCAESDDNIVDSVDLVQSLPVIAPDAEISVVYAPDMFTYKTGDGGKKSFTRGTNLLKIGSVVGGEPQTLTLIPYYLRDNRTHSSMRVWFMEQSAAGGGIETVTFDKASDIENFELYGGAGGFTLQDGMLKTDSRMEAKAIYKPYTDLDEFTVWASFRQLSTFMNNGLYILASDPNDEQDKIDAINVQIERSANAATYKVSIFKFSSVTGYAGPLAASKDLPWTGEDIRLAVSVVNGIVSASVNGAECVRYVLTASDPKSGAVGIRAMHCAAYIDDFSVMCESIPLHKDELDQTVKNAEAIDLSGYKTAGATAVLDAIAKAKAALRSAVSDLEINSATAALNKALALLQAKSDTTALNSAIEKAEKIELSDYTDKTAAELGSALAAAKQITGDDDQSVIDDAAAAIENAIASLEKKPAKPTQTGDSGEGLSGGAIAGIVIGSIAAAAAAAGGAVYAVKRKKKSPAAPKQAEDEDKKD